MPVYVYVISKLFSHFFTNAVKVQQEAPTSQPILSISGGSILPPIVHKTLKDMNNQGTVVSISMVGAMKSHYGRKSVHSAVAFGAKKDVGHPNTVEIVSNVEVKAASSSPIYEVKFVSKAQLPKVENRWNKELLLQEALALVFNGKIEYGYENSNTKQVRM